jgi:dihydrofolate reductase
MAKLIYSMLASLDGYVADAEGRFEWAAPDAEVHGFINDLSRPIGTYLLGRRMYEVLAVWDGIADQAGHEPHIGEFAELWAGADKVVYSRTIADPLGPRTRIESEFEPDAVRQLKAAGAGDLAIGGPGLAGQALGAGLVDELQLYVAPVVIGAGTRVLPDGVRLGLELLDERRFDGGFAFLRYGVDQP